MTSSAPRLSARLGSVRRHRLLAVLHIAAAGALLALGWSVHSATAVVDADLAIVRALHASAFAELTVVATAITDLAATRAILLTAVLVSLVLLAARHWRGALAILLAVGVTQLAVAALKGLVERGRPPDSAALAEPAGYSFPSGHSGSAMAVYGLLAFLLARYGRGPWSTGACCIALAMVVAVGATRVYLGAHYPTDVVAGWLVGALIAASAWWLVGRGAKSRSPIAAG